MKALKSVLVLLSFHQLSAFPAYWFSRSACQPQAGDSVMGMTVTQDGQNTFDLSISGSQGVTSSYLAGSTYSVNLKFFSDASHYLISASQGNLTATSDSTVTTPRKNQLAACSNAQYGVIANTRPVKSATFSWVAPKAGSGSVGFGVTTSAGMYTSVVTNSLTLSETKYTAPTTSVAPAKAYVAPTTTPVAQQEDSGHYGGSGSGSGYWGDSGSGYWSDSSYGVGSEATYAPASEAVKPVTYAPEPEPVYTKPPIYAPEPVTYAPEPVTYAPAPEPVTYAPAPDPVTYAPDPVTYAPVTYAPHHEPAPNSDGSGSENTYSGSESYSYSGSDSGYGASDSYDTPTTYSSPPATYALPPPPPVVYAPPLTNTSPPPVYSDPEEYTPAVQSPYSGPDYSGKVKPGYIGGKSVDEKASDDKKTDGKDVGKPVPHKSWGKVRDRFKNKKAKRVERRKERRQKRGWNW